MKKIIIACLLAINGSMSLAEIKPVNVFEEQLSKAQGGQVFAQRNVGAYYYFGYDGVPQDIQKSFQWFAQAAISGDRKAQEMIAYMYNQGIHVPKNDELALVWHEESRKTLVREQTYLLNCKPYKSEIGCLAQWESLPSLKEQQTKFSQNLEIVKANTDKAIVANAQYELFKSYMFGEAVAISHGDALKWLMNAAYNKHAKASFNMAVLFFLTKGVGADFVEFMEIAENLGDEDAILLMKVIRLDEKNYHLENYAPITAMVKPFIELKY